MWAAGISTRKVEAVASDLGLESMSRSRVSRLCEGLDGEVSEMRGADLSSGEWPYLLARRHLRAVPRGGRAEVGGARHRGGVLVVGPQARRRR